MLYRISLYVLSRKQIMFCLFHGEIRKMSLWNKTTKQQRTTESELSLHFAFCVVIDLLSYYPHPIIRLPRGINETDYRWILRIWKPFMTGLLTELKTNFFIYVRIKQRRCVEWFRNQTQIIVLESEYESEEWFWNQSRKMCRTRLEACANWF